MRIIQQAAIRPHLFNPPLLAAAAKYRPLAMRILGFAGVAATGPSADRARAIVGWIASHAIHPASELHPSGWALNTDILPAGETWASFNAVFDVAGAGNRIETDKAFWYAIYPNGRAMLERLVGTFSDDETVADDGMLTEYAPGQWRIRNFASFRALQCTHQSKIAEVLLAAIGIFSTDVSTTNHDPLCYFDADRGRWLYIDATFGEMIRFGGDYLSPLELVTKCRAGDAPLLKGEKLLNGADYIAVSYFAPPRLPGGMVSMALYMHPQWDGGFAMRDPRRFYGIPGQAIQVPGAKADDAEARASDLMPTLGAGFAGIERNGVTTEVRLCTNWPGHVGYQLSPDGGETWAAIGAVSYAEPVAGERRYRSVDASGFAGMSAVVTV